MSANWKYKIFRDWNFIRIVRLTLAIMIITAAWKSEEWLFLFIGGILFLQAILNVGCCAGSCSISMDEDKELHSKNTSVVFEEIKTNNPKIK